MPPPHHDEIVNVGIRLVNRPPVAPTLTRELVIDFEGSGVIPPQPGQCRRVGVAGCAGACDYKTLIGERGAGNERARGKRPDSVQQIPARDAPVHSKITV